MKSNCSPGVILFVVATVTLAGCSGSGLPPSIGTPGLIYPPNSAQQLPLPLRRWDYDPIHMLLFREGATEGSVTTQPILALYDWRTNTVNQLSIPDLNRLSDVAQGPDSNALAYTTFPDDRVVLFDVKQQTVRTITTGSSPTFSPDGQQLAVWQSNKLVLVKLSTLHSDVIEQLTDPEWYQNHLVLCCMVWSPDGARLAYHLTHEIISGGKIQMHAERILVVDLQTRQETIAASGEFLGDPSWSPDGKFLTYIDGLNKSTALMITDPVNHCTVGKLQIDNLYRAFWSPDGSVIAVVYWVSNLYFVDVERVFGSKATELKCP